jgi:hypothetical protein
MSTSDDTEFVFVQPDQQTVEQRRANLLAQGIDEEFVNQLLND